MRKLHINSSGGFRGWRGAVLALLLLVAAGCGAAPFPGTPAASGVRDVPFVVTYNHDFPTGQKDRGSFAGQDRSADIKIFSAADLNNLLAAANVSTSVSGGVLSGFVLTGGVPVAGATLEVRDFEGNVLPDVFYNGLGGVPDFAAEEGTSTQGSFTIFNVPEGEVFLSAGSGGRGMGHVWSYERSVGVKPIQVVPVSVAHIGITGSIVDILTGINVFPVKLSALGLQKDPVFSDERGLLQESPLVGFRFVLPSNGTFTIRSDTDGYARQYQEMDTNLSDLRDAVDLTRSMEMMPQEQIDDWFAQANVAPIEGTGMIFAYLMSAEDSPAPNNWVELFDMDGAPVGDVFLVTAVPDPNDPTQIINRLDRSGTAESNESFFLFALNVPPGPVFFRGGGYTESSGNRQKRAGAATTTVYPNALTYTNYLMPATATEEDPRRDVVTSMEGVVTLPDLTTTVTDVVIDVAGYPAGPGRYDGPIRSETSFSGDTYFINGVDRAPPGGSRFNQVQSSLLTNSEYLVRVSSLPGETKYVDTFQHIDTSAPNILDDGSMVVTQDLQIYTRSELEAMAAVAGLPLDPDRGVVIGQIFDTRSAGTVSGIELVLTDENGDTVGDIRYMDTVGLPHLLNGTSSRGEFAVFNVPEGVMLLHVVSKDDAGALSFRVYPGGVTVIPTVLVADAPVERVNVSGVLTDLLDNPPPGARLTFHGEPSSTESSSTGYLTIPVDTSGNYSADLGISGEYIVSADSGSSYLKAYNMGIRTGVTPVRQQQLRTLSKTHLQTIADTYSGVPGSLQQQPGLGVVAGRVVSTLWTDDGPPGSKQVYSTGINGPTAIRAALLNTDGFPDLLIADGDADEITVYFGNEEGGFEFAGTQSVGLNPVDLEQTDANQDGVGDILVLSQGAASGEINVLLGTRRGVFRLDPARRVLLQNSPIQMELGDMDGDGQRDDLVVLNGGGSPSISIFYRNDQGNFEEADYSPHFLDGSQPASMVVRDVHVPPEQAGQLNATFGADDVIVVMEGSDTVETYANTRYEMVRELPIILPVGYRPTDVSMVNLGGGVDERYRGLDYVILNAGTNSVAVIDTSSGVPTQISPDVPLDPGCMPRSIRLREVNSDGRIDLVVMCSGLGTVSIYLGEGAGFFSPWQCLSAGCRKPPLASGTAPVDFVISDLDPVPGRDIAVINRFSNNLVVYGGIKAALEGVPVQVTDFEGVSIGEDVIYLDSAGLPIPGATATGPDGRFMVMNVPPGNAFVSALSGDNGNQRFVVFPDGMTYGQLNVVPNSPDPVTLRGKVTDAVSSPLAGIAVEFSGTGISTITEDAFSAAGVYEATVPSNQNFSVIRLQEAN